MPVTNLNGRFAARIWHLEKGDPVSLNNCAPVCVNVLANPVTNSVYYKAAMSWLPRQGCIPTGVVCKAQRRISWILPHHLSLEWPRNFICLFPEPESTLAFSWFPSPPPPRLFPALSRPPFLGSVYLLIWGWSRTQSESGPRSQSELLRGIPGDRTHNPSWKKIFQKIPFGHSVVTAPFSVHVQWAWPGVCQEPCSVCPSFVSPIRSWERNLWKEQFWWRLLSPESLKYRYIKMQMSL